MSSIVETAPLIVAIKASLREELRRFNLYGEKASFEALEEKLRSLFHINPKRRIILKYEDEENDVVTISSDEEFALALSTCSGNKVLRITISEKTAAQRVEAPAPLQPAGGIEVAPAPSSPVPAPTFCEPLEGPCSEAGKANWQQKLEHRKEKLIAKLAKKEEKIAKKLLKVEKGEKKEKKEKKERKERKEKDEKEEKEWKPRRSSEEWMAKKSEKLEWRKAKMEEKLAKKAEKMEFIMAKREGRMHPGRGGGSKFVARFVKHVTLEDESNLPPNTSFTKTWRFRNDGTTAWPEGTNLIFVSRHGDQLGAPSEVLVAEGKAVAPTETVDVSVPMLAPAVEGRYQGFWRLCSPEGQRFGQRVWVLITVGGEEAKEEPSLAKKEEENKKPEEEGLLVKETLPEDAEMERFLKKLAAMGMTITKK